MAQKIDIVDGESLTYTPDTSDTSRTVVLSKWVCDKHYDKVLLKSAYAEPILLDKISSANPITINSVSVTTPEAAQAAIGANW